uniref:Uncharacterized protein n=1 Tax=Romanomermis culicivorax TaxID=13658 RepID=A0A915KAD9_ROMCU
MVGIDIDNGTFLSEFDVDDSALDETTWHPESSSSAAKTKFVAKNLAPLPKLIKLEKCTKITEILCKAHEEFEQENKNFS